MKQQQIITATIALIALMVALFANQMSNIGSATSAIQEEQEGRTIYIRQGPALLASIEQGEIIHHHTDYLGSNRAETNNNGDKTTEIQYKPYGNSENKKAKYTGKTTTASKTVNLGAREYDTKTKRFTVPDPLLQESTGPYNYAANNPFMYSDPNGKSEAIAIPYVLEFTGATLSVGAATAGAALVVIGGLAVATYDQIQNPAPLVNAVPNTPLEEGRAVDVADATTVVQEPLPESEAKPITPIEPDIFSTPSSQIIDSPLIQPAQENGGEQLIQRPAEAPADVNVLQAGPRKEFRKWLQNEHNLDWNNKGRVVDAEGNEVRGTDGRPLPTKKHVHDSTTPRTIKNMKAKVREAMRARRENQNNNN